MVSELELKTGEKTWENVATSQQFQFLCVKIEFLDHEAKVILKASVTSSILAEIRMKNIRTVYEIWLYEN